VSLSQTVCSLKQHLHRSLIALWSKQAILAAVMLLPEPTRTPSPLCRRHSQSASCTWPSSQAAAAWPRERSSLACASANPVMTAIARCFASVLSQSILASGGPAWLPTACFLFVPGCCPQSLQQRSPRCPHLRHADLPSARHTCMTPSARAVKQGWVAMSRIAWLLCC